MIFIGLDIGRESHRYCIVDEAKKVLDKGILPNASWSFEAWCRHVETVDGEVVVGVETQSGLSSPLDQFLEQQGWQVRQVTPEAVKTYRETVLRIHNKTDETDALTIATVLVERADTQRRVKQPRRPLRHATRWLERLVRMHTRLCNGLRKSTAAYWPEVTQPSSPFYRMDLKYVMLLFEKCPDPAVMAARGAKGMLRFFRDHGSNVPEKTVETIVQLARQNTVCPEEKQILLRETQMLARSLRQLEDDKAEVESLILKLAKGDLQVQQLAAVRGVSVVLAATFLGETQDIDNFRTDSHVASYGGIGLRRIQTGKSKDTQGVQWRANRHLKRCLYVVADCMRANDLRSREHYNKKVAAGKTHQQALRCVARQVVRMFFAMLKRGRVYDPVRAITLRTKEVA